MSTKAERQQEWFAIMREFESSGQTQSAFCKEKNLAFNTFIYYRHQYRAQQKVTRNASNPFIEIQCSSAISTEPFSLSFPNGIKLCLPQQFNDRQFVKLIEVLRTY